VQGAILDQGATILNKQGQTFHTGGAPQFLGSASLLDRFERFRFVSGHKPQAANQVALDKATADKEHFKLGDPGTIQATTGQHTRNWAGIGTVGVVNWFGGASMALLTLPAAQLASGKVGHYDAIDAAGKPGVGPKELSSRIRAVLPRTVEVRTGQQQAAKQS